MEPGDDFCAECGRAVVWIERTPGLPHGSADSAPTQRRRLGQSLTDHKAQIAPSSHHAGTESDADADGQRRRLGQRGRTLPAKETP